jgi:hypothetical protein
MLKRTFLVVCAVTFLVTGAVQAQENATLVLRSGERISGQLIDLGGSAFTMRVNGQERQVGKNDVAAVEFQGASQLNNDWFNKLQSGQPIVVLKNGQIIEGRLSDIHGAGSAQLTIDTPSGQRELNAGEVAQVYFSVPPGLTAAGAAAPATAVATSGTALESGAISVPANQRWVPTGISVRKGQTLFFRTTGQIQFSGDANDRAGAAGAMNQRRAAGAPIPAALAGALIGRIGNGQAFAIGDQTSVVMPANGQLFLGINDDEFSDNSGNFSVVISRQ